MTRVIPEADLRQFIEALLLAHGVAEAEVTLLTDKWLWTEMIGRETQGLGRLHIYLRRLQHGLIASPCQPTFIAKSENMQILDGDNGFGQYLGTLAMHKACDLAEAHGIGMVGVKHSNHFGANAYYCYLAAKRGQLSIVTSNSTPRVAPYGGTKAVFGTNPFGFGAPTREGQAVLVDFSTGAAAGSTITRAAQEGRTIPEGVLIDHAGQPTTDPNDKDAGAMLPFGGPKGYGLSLMVEILSSVITGASISHQVASFHNDLDRPVGTGHMFIAIDIAHLLPLEAYYQRITLLIDWIKQAKHEHVTGEILIPGETRWRTFAQQQRDGVTLNRRTVDSLSRLAAAVDLALP